jgi:hypothetical protein
MGQRERLGSGDVEDSAERRLQCQIDGVNDVGFVNHLEHRVEPHQGGDGRQA